MPTSNWTDDPWIKNWSPIHPAKMHAMGRIALAWSACETNLFLLFCSISQLKPTLAWTIIYEMGDVALAERARVIAADRDFFPEEISFFAFAKSPNRIAVLNASVETFRVLYFSW